MKRLYGKVLEDALSFDIGMAVLPGLVNLPAFHILRRARSPQCSATAQLSSFAFTFAASGAILKPEVLEAVLFGLLSHSSVALREVFELALSLGSVLGRPLCETQPRSCGRNRHLS